MLVSAAGKPALDQMAVPPKTNEMGAFATFFAALMAAYGGSGLFEILTLDAGFTSLDNANLVDQAHIGYVMALKQSQPELWAEGQRLLLSLTLQAPAAQTPWERHQGRWVQRSLYRSDEIAGHHQWTHLRQVWLVRQVTTEDRYFLTNLRNGRLSSAQMLRSAFALGHRKRLLLVAGHAVRRGRPSLGYRWPGAGGAGPVSFDDLQPAPAGPQTSSGFPGFRAIHRSAVVEATVSVGLAGPALAMDPPYWPEPRRLTSLGARRRGHPSWGISDRGWT